MIGMLVQSDLSKNINNIQEALTKLLEVTKLWDKNIATLESFVALSKEKRE